MTTEIPDSTHLLEQGRAAIQAGDRARARALLMAAVRANPQSAAAWLWLSGVLDTPAQQRECLQRALALEPDNLLAQRGLAALQRAEEVAPPLPATRPGSEGVSPSTVTTRAERPPPQPDWVQGQAQPQGYVPLPTPAISLLLLILGGTGMVLTWAALRRIGAEIARWAILALALVAGPVLALVGLLFFGVLLRMAGRSLGGQGNSSRVQAGLALAAAPQVASLILWLMQLILIPVASFGGGTAPRIQIVAALVCGVLHVFFALASGYFAVAGVASAHRITMARAAATWLLAVVFVVTTLATIFVSSATLIALRGG
ncbi:YIP1 family protein [Candidatus Oscillochloris fontis]|uniref:YIP1 family protein n=1 Tax=Candidatus Oscillochloris fontis TaxID=2496868 RepID=UPI00101C3BE4|nr:YIP1 family protein [Candidatus Oscillochloris fontis]